jgi:hypothetical protein
MGGPPYGGGLYITSTIAGNFPVNFFLWEIFKFPLIMIIYSSLLNTIVYKGFYGGEFFFFMVFFRKNTGAKFSWRFFSSDKVYFNDVRNHIYI